MNVITIQNGLMPPVGAGGASPSDAAAKHETFGDIFKDTIQSVDQLHQDADKNIEKLVAGKEVDIHQTMIAMEKADVSFQLVMQVRNKLIAAYEEMMRMQV